ncbi:MAG: hypothetical protein SGPRY_014461 [Prymnesium sp.]
MSVTLEYDEQITGDDHAACYVSTPTDKNFYISAKNALPWEEAPDGDYSRWVIASIWLESLVRDLRVADPRQLQPVSFLTRVLDLEWIIVALDAFVGHGLLDAEDGDAQAVMDYQSFHELHVVCDKLIAAHPEQSEFQMEGEDAWESTENLTAGPLDWLENVTLEDLTRQTKNLRCYVDLAKIVGPRAVDGERMAFESQLRAMAGEQGGGQLMQALKGYFLTPAQQGLVQPSLLAKRHSDFLVETTWPSIPV